MSLPDRTTSLADAVRAIKWAALLSTVLAAALACLALQLTVESRPLIDGVDFYIYALYGRDLANGASDIPFARYHYFPGGYVFWKAVTVLSDGSLEALQWAYVGVLLCNATLIGAILIVLAESWQGGLAAAALYLLAANRLDALEGCAEPIATAPYLLGLWLWLLFSRRGWSVAGLLSLATGLGLALFVKQQGGLLALGAVGLLPLCGLPRSGAPRTFKAWCLLPLAAAAVFATAFALDGGGLPALLYGLQFAAQYQAEGSWGDHLIWVFGLTQPVSNFWLSGIVIWGLLIWQKQRWPPEYAALAPALGLSIFTVLGCMFQFAKRGYLHYSLLALPSLIIVAGLVLALAVRWAERASPRQNLGPSLGLLAAAITLLLHSIGTAPLLRHVTAQLVTPSRPAGFTQQIKSTFTPLCRHLSPGEDLLLVPAREQVVHWLCGTRAISRALGYAWLTLDYAPYRSALASPSLQAVFVFGDRAGAYERDFFLANDKTVVVKDVQRSGFRETFSFGGGTLYRKETGPAPPAR